MQPVPSASRKLASALPYLPLAHSLHADCPACSWYVPARHSAQSSALADPVAATCLPAPHLIHASDDADLEYSPAGHAVHLVPADDTEYGISVGIWATVGTAAKVLANSREGVHKGPGGRAPYTGVPLLTTTHAM